MEIVQYRNTPRDPYQRGPHIIMRVLEDAKGTDIRASVGPVLKAGSSQNDLVYRFVNMEQYPLRSASISIRSMDPSSLYCSYNMSGDPYLSDLSGLQVPAADQMGPGILEVPVLVDVPLNASSSTVRTHVRILGRDILNKLVVKDIDLAVAISPYVPSAEVRVISIQTSTVRPGKGFSMTLQLMNSGDGNLSGLELVLVSNSSKTSIVDPYWTYSELDPGSIQNVRFDCLADASMSEGETVYLYLMAQYKDATGQVHGYSDGEPIPIMVSSLPPKEKEERTDGLVYIMIGLIVSTLLLTVGLVASVVIFMMMRKGRKEDGNGNKERSKNINIQDEAPRTGTGTMGNIATMTSAPQPPETPVMRQPPENSLPPMKDDRKKPFGSIDDIFDGTAIDKL
jgi:hypothetical protein